MVVIVTYCCNTQRKKRITFPVVSSLLPLAVSTNECNENAAWPKWPISCLKNRCLCRFFLYSLHSDLLPRETFNLNTQHHNATLYSVIGCVLQNFANNLPHVMFAKNSHCDFSVPSFIDSSISRTVRARHIRYLIFKIYCCHSENSIWFVLFSPCSVMCLGALCCAL